MLRLKEKLSSMFLKGIFKNPKIFLVFFLAFSLPVFVYFLGFKTNFSKKASYSLSGQRANLQIDIKNLYQLNATWNYLAQGGEEKGGSLVPVLEKVKLLKPRYIRIDHIFDFYEPVKRDSLGKLIFDWSRFDSEIENILETGAKPFISLSYMPQAISNGSEVDLPVSWEEWQYVVQKTIEHVSGKNELAIEDVYYEVWNEPDLFGAFRLKGEKNYLLLYKYASKGAQSAENTLSFKFGGPATTHLNRKWFEALLSFVKKNNLRMDFYSWHRYSKFIEDYEKDLEDAKKYLVSLGEPVNIEFIISESGFDSEVNTGYDTEFSAMHTLALYASTFMRGNKIFLFEIKDGLGQEKYWGRWGILTHENFGDPVEKPRYQALLFLNELKGYWSPVYGQGTWVKALASKNNSLVKILFVNYDPFGTHWENVPFTIYNLPKGNYLVRKRQLFGQTTEYEIRLDKDSWGSQLLMPPNSAFILEIGQ